MGQSKKEKFSVRNWFSGRTLIRRKGNENQTKSFYQTGFPGALFFLSNYLSTAEKIDFREKLLPVGILDYPEEKFLVALDSLNTIGRLKSCAKEPETVAWLNNNMKPGDIFYDIGSNIGAYSFVATSITKRKCKVFSIEPSFSTFSSLVSNIKLNHLEEVVFPFQIALGARTGIKTLYYSSVSSGTALHNLETPRDYRGDDFTPAFAQPVLTFRLDDLVTNLGFNIPNLIKIDVDGLEYEVLRGGEKLIDNVELRTILVELYFGKNDAAHPIIDYLESKNFRIKERFARESQPASLYNYVFERRND